MSADSERKAATLLVEMAKAGDPLAFGRLVERYRDRIYALALHLTGSDSEADDIAQDVFIKAHLKLHTFEGRSHFFTWLYRMAVNQSLNAKRKRSRKRETEFDPRLARALEVDAAGNPERAASLRQQYARLLEALDSLSNDMRSTVVLVCMQGLSHAEAAVVLDCAENTVSWRIHAARDKLRAAIAKRDRAKPGNEKSLAQWLSTWGMATPLAN